MHREAYEYVKGITSQIEPPETVIEIGSYDVNGSVRDLFPDAEYTGIDVRPGRGVDVVADGATYKHPAPVQAVVCCEALEHAENADAVMRNAYKLLDSTGIFIMTAAGPTRGAHGNDGGHVGNEFYRNIDRETLTGWLEDAGFTDYYIDEDTRAGDIYAVAYKGTEGGSE